jgi:hypothetical protein
MRLRTLFSVILACLTTYGIVHAQKPWKDYSELFETEYGAGAVPVPPDYNEPHEFTRARLKYTRVGILHPGYDTGQWGWGTDYPRGDRHFLEGLRRLTLIDVRSVEQVVELDGSDDIYNWPFLYGVEVGHWKLFDDEADQFREYLERGGFFMTDDFHGTLEWDNFVQGVRKVFGSRPIVDIANSDEIFHVMYDLDTRVQIPGRQWMYSRRVYEFDGFEPKWRAVYDDKGRIMMAILHNMDISDAIEWSDDPTYPEQWANLAYRISVNYVLYDLTH